MEPQVSTVLKIQRLRTRGENIMTNKINLVINLSILALLIYLSVAVKQLQDKVFPDPNIMIPLISQDSKTDLEMNIREFLNRAIESALTEMETE
jgi:monomeric isocitrate dehydrogenase